MNRRSSYSSSCSCSPLSSNAHSHKHHLSTNSTSSAFSASANPDEDWTKITDLAERRRIQNRIAQRNYRKKLKKRLEDLERLERQAGSISPSPSPEAKYAEPEISPAPGYKSSSSASRMSEQSAIDYRSYAPNGFEYPYPRLSDDKRMFSYQHTRQLSTSPPPAFSCQAYPSIEQSHYAPQMPTYMSYQLPVSGVTSSCSMPPSNVSYQPAISTGNKNDMYEEDDMNPFSLSFASMAGVDVTSQFSYPPAALHTPELSDSSLEHSTSCSPPDYLTLPRTPLSLPLTPHLRMWESTK